MRKPPIVRSLNLTFLGIQGSGFLNPLFDRSIVHTLSFSFRLLWPYLPQRDLT